MSMDSVINIDDCGTQNSITVTSIIDGGEIIQALTDRILGRVIAEPINDSDGNLLFEEGTMLDEDAVSQIESLNLSSLQVRSPMTCEASIGVCSKCYGRDLARGHLVHRGEAVGIVAAPVSYTHLRAHETLMNLVCRLLLEKKNFFNDTATTEIYT